MDKTKILLEDCLNVMEHEIHRLVRASKKRALRAEHVRSLVEYSKALVQIRKLRQDSPEEEDKSVRQMTDEELKAYAAIALRGHLPDGDNDGE